ncbi:hypothetical protein Pla108_12010 [Botrimarina colliarenosi]|uniref:Uncharacterized protein n=1 Tax=Botrimarina colliarenosi TaxID=2528001 RepID=A0A5C6APX9_9BACT|nr:hypothetical protein [Botrimarina colliarenosi]TWU00254.1 hypothetical protein Pla108_12010 [Botrimarina colliarenosi]
MRHPLLAFAALAVILPLGCNQAPNDPAVDPSEFPKALVALESQTEEIFAAFDADDPKSADRPLHQIGKTFNSIKRLAKPAGLTDQQLTELDDATGVLLDAFGELHKPMHQATFPEDFDFEPIREKINEGLVKLRAAVPAEMAAKMEAAAAKRAEAAPPADASPDAEASPADEAAAPDQPADDTGARLTRPGPFRLVSAGPAARAPLCPTVMLFDAESLDSAAERVNRAAEIVAVAPPGDRWVQFVPTLHTRLNEDLTIDAYGLQGSRRGPWESASNFTVATDDLADRFRDAFAAAIGQAVRRGLNVSLLPHLDPAGGPVNEWRNLYRFAPGDVIGPGSYESLLIDPLADAVEAGATSDTRVDFALSGEMGRSLFEHPADYLQLVRRLRERFATNPRTAGVRLGVALNWSGLAGELDQATINRGAVAELFAAFDFVAFSCYAPVSVPPTPQDFQQATQNFLQELRSLGGDLPPEARLVYAEAGIGGDTVRPGADGPVYATPAEVAAKPYEGRGSSRLSPWTNPALAELRQQYHAALCEYLQNGPDTTPPIDKAFLWSEGPWDPQGVAGERFRDDAIADAIDQHNAVDPN